MKKQIIWLLLLFFSSDGFAQNTSYFIDNITGNDKNNGKIKNTAWKTLSRINTIVFQPGDRIYFKRDQVFNGYLRLRGSGVDGNPIRLSSFGTGKRPIINTANNDYAVQLLDGEYWEISDIETTGGQYAGIFVGCTKDDLELDHLRISNCCVHDIGDTSKIDWDYSKSTGGIIVVNGTLDSFNKPVFYNSVFNDVVVDNCIVRYNHRWTCLSISSGKKNGIGGNANRIRNCIAEFSAADGIRMNGVRNSLIEYCVMYRNGAWPKPNGRNLGGLGAWFFDGDKCTIQFCEAGYVRGSTTDAGAFDIDYWQKNSTVQYCYGHDCAGYGISVFGADPSFPTENSVVRYNMFSNNGRDSAFAFEGDFFVFTWNGGLLNGVNIHDNTSYWDPVLPFASLKFDADFTGNNPNVFKNNIIQSSHSLLDSMKNSSLQCDSNTYWAVSGKPVWQMGKEKYYSLEDWQKATGQDLHSTHGRINKTIPSSHTYPFSSQPFRKNQAGSIIQVGKKAPEFSTYTSSKQKINLSDYKQSIVLLSFINSADALGTNKTLSQLTYIKSMKRQYGDKGLKIILVDESSVISPNARINESLPNFVHDHELGDIAIISDTRNLQMAARWGVTTVPATFLLKDGAINQKWESIVLPARLAFAIEDALKK